MSRALVKQFKDEAGWLEARRATVGSSDAAALLGLSPFSNALLLWGEKTGRRPAQASTLRLRVGKALEPFIIDEASRRLDERILSVGRTLAYCPDNKNMSATIDAVTGAGDCNASAALVLLKAGSALAIRELKTVSNYAKGWDIATDDPHAPAPEPPLYVLVQAQHQYACYPAATGLKIVALIGLGENDDNGLVTYEVPRHDGIIASLKNASDEFMECVRTGTPPSTFPGGNQELAAKTLFWLYPKSDPSMTVKLPAEFNQTLDNLLELKAAVKACEEEVTANENRFKVLMGEAETAETDDGRRITWKTQARAGYTVQPGEARYFRTPSTKTRKKGT